MKSVFHKEHIPMVEKEIACIVDLCGQIAINIKNLEVDKANLRKDDLLNSLSEITTLYKLQEKQAEKKVESNRGAWF